MRTLTRTEVFEANKTRTVLNWVSHQTWYNKSISDMIKNTLNHYSNMQGVESDITITELKNKFRDYIKKCVDNKKYLEKELDKERKSFVSPSYRNIKAFFKGEELPFETVEEYQSYLKDYILTEL